MTRVLLITIDSLREDHCSAEQFPNSWSILDEEFDRFTQAYSHGVATPFAFPGIVAGYPPEGDGSLPPTPTLAELTDGQSVCYANNPHLRPDRGYDRGFDKFSYLGGRSGQNLKEKVIGRLGEVEVVKRGYAVVQNVLESLSTDGFDEPYRPAAEQVRRITSALEDDVTFCWGHFQDPHYPFSLESVPDRDLTDRFDPQHVQQIKNRYTDGDIVGDSEAMSELVAVYDENVGYLDRQLADLLETLAENGWFEDNVVAITADHGEVFGEHGLTNHPWDAPPVDELVKVPLFVSTPNNDSTTYDHLVQHSDLFQSLARFLDSDPPSAEHRYDLYDESRRRVICKSNAVIRCVTPNGSMTKDRDGTTEVVGDVTESDREYVETVSFPAIEKSANSIPGVENQEHQEIETQLEALGYVE